MTSFRQNPDSDENVKATRDNERAVFAAKMMAIPHVRVTECADPCSTPLGQTMLSYWSTLKEIKLMQERLKLLGEQWDDMKNEMLEGDLKDMLDWWSMGKNHYVVSERWHAENPGWKMSGRGLERVKVKSGNQ
jgi:hypothetical protein